LIELYFNYLDHHLREGMNLKISVITAAYNCESTVAEAIASVAEQTYPNLEHVIIEGKSKDQTLKMIQRMAHPKMQLLSEPDKGIYDALNKGIKLSSGDVIGFVHGDDILAHNKVISLIAKIFEDPSIEAVFGDLDYVSKLATSRVIRHWAAGPFQPQRLKFGWMPPHPTLYLRRKVYEQYGNFDTTLKISADYDFILRYFTQTSGKSSYIPEVIYKMRLGGTSNRNWENVIQKIKEDYLAIRRRNVGGFLTLFLKNISKINQFFHK
jgi:glycosyltransferase involved in cell wall biosynthesis